MSEARCRCGHDRRHPCVEARPSYSLWAYVKLGLVGITAVPREVTFYCTACHEFFDQTREADELKSYAG